MDYRGLSGQSAIEYLMTYGWMLLVVAIVGGAIFSMVGDQSIESVSGFDSSHVNVQDFGISSENGLSFVMNDPMGQTTVSELTVSSSDTGNVTYIIHQDISQQDVISLPGVVPSDEVGNVDVDITYSSGNLEDISVSGEITGALEVDQSFKNREIVLEGLIAYWPLSQQYSEGARVYDLSHNNQHGQKIGEPEFVEEFGHGEALELDGEGQAIELETVGLSDDEAWTISMWVQSFEEDNNQGIIGNSGGSTEQIATWLGGDGYRWRESDADHDFTVDVGDAEAGDISQPHMITIAVDPTAQYAVGYVNDEFVDEDNEYEGRSLHRVNSLGAGWEGNFWEGRLSDVKIYDRVLTSEEVERLYRSTIS